MRELSLGYTLPSSFVHGLLGGAIDRITFNLIGRNLFTITGYRGYDPEVGIAGGPIDSPQLVRADFRGYPNFRTVAFSAQIVF